MPVFLSFIFGLTVANADVYRPFTFNDPQMSQRADIGKLVPGLKTDLPATSDGSIVKIAAQDADLYFFSELGALLKNAAAPIEPIPSDAANVLAKMCPQHTRFAIDTLLSNSAGCESVQAEFKQSFAAVSSVCRYVYLPEQFVETWPAGKVDGKQMDSLNGILLTAGEALSHLNFPGNIISPALREKFRTVLVKLRNTELKMALAQADSAYASSLALAERQPDCLDRFQIKTAVTALRTELKTSAQFVDSIQSQGLVQAQKDRDLILAKGRSRPNLPYPSLSDADRQLFTFIVSAVYWRMRGGGLLDEPQGTQDTRKFFTKLPMGFLGKLNGGDFGKSIGESMLMPLILKGWGEYMDMGHTANESDKYHDLVFMTDRGAYQVANAVKSLSQNGYEAAHFAAGGLQMGPCYYFAWEQLSTKYIGHDLALPYKHFLHGATSWGELCVGASLGLGMSRSLLAGYAR